MAKSQGEVSQLSPFRSDGFRYSKAGDWLVMRRWPKDSQNYASSRRGHQARVHIDQMVLVMARQGAAPHPWWTKVLKVRVEKQLQEAKGPDEEQA